jgi:hypothetical protein
MTQALLAQAMGVSQNRVSRMEALGGKVSLVADLPTGSVLLL